MNINLLVIRSHNPQALSVQYAALGMEFSFHKHGNGPYHYAAEFNGQVFEIYPVQDKNCNVDSHVRIGFEVGKLDALLKQLSDSNWIISSPIKHTEWGTIAVLQDLDGRKIELKNK